MAGVERVSLGRASLVLLEGCRHGMELPDDPAALLACGLWDPREGGRLAHGQGGPSAAAGSPGEAIRMPMGLGR